MPPGCPSETRPATWYKLRYRITFFVPGKQAPRAEGRRKRMHRCDVFSSHQFLSFPFILILPVEWRTRPEKVKFPDSQSGCRFGEIEMPDRYALCILYTWKEDNGLNGRGSGKLLLLLLLLLLLDEKLCCSPFSATNWAWGMNVQSMAKYPSIFSPAQVPQLPACWRDWLWNLTVTVKRSLSLSICS